MLAHETFQIPMDIGRMPENERNASEASKARREAPKARGRRSKAVPGRMPENERNVSEASKAREARQTVFI